MRTTIRTAGWLASAALVGATILAPAALAQSGNQTNVSSENRPSNCTGGPNGSDITPGAGQVAWLFVHSDTNATSGTLTANFQSAGTKTKASYIQGGIKYVVTTNRPETLVSFSDTIDGGVLTLSHTCYGPTPEVTPTPTPEVTPTPTPEVTPTPTPEVTPTPTPEVTPTPTPEVTPTPTPEVTPTPTPEVTPTPTPETTPTPTPTATQPESTPTPSPSGTVVNETGTPRVTPPSTDTTGSTGSTTGGGLPIVLVALAGVLVTSLLLAPRRVRR